MNANIERLMVIFAATFILAVGALVVWQVVWVIPAQQCEKAHKWWDPGKRICAQPVLISDITGRVIRDPKALAEAKAALGRPAAK
jgi:hypothetical protein